MDTQTIALPIPPSRDDIKGIVLECLKEFHSIPKKSFLKKSEFAKAIGKSQSFVDAERRSGKLEWRRSGGTVIIPISQLEKYT